MDKWKELQATATMKNSITEMLNYLKKLVFDSRINKKELTKEDFEKEIENRAKVTHFTIINKFFKNSENYHQQANVEFSEMVQRENKVEEEQKGE